MHLLIPFAFSSSEGCQQTLAPLKLPHLSKLLARLSPLPTDLGDEFSLSAPHERALVRAMGMGAPDGQIPWAALHASNTQPAQGAWAFITPCHWQVGTTHIVMQGPDLPDFSADESHTLLTAMQPYFEEDGITLQFDQSARWLACGEALQGLATASADRVVGRNVAPWMPRGPGATRLQRLQTEMQMLLYHHPVNDARAARGVPTVNSFWLSGTGTLPPTQRQVSTPAPPVVVTRLREPALRENWPAWAQAWAALDATECAALLAELKQGGDHQLTLCGERHAQTYTTTRQNFWQKFMNNFGTQRPSIVLQQL